MFSNGRLFSKILLTCSIGICSMLGDQGLKYGNTAALRALFDNVTHAVVGSLTWSLILILSKKPLMKNLSSILLSLFLSSFIDIDHFIAARSWHLSDATKLKRRPFLHCTTVPIAIWIILVAFSKIYNSASLNHYSWIICASFLSHHIRDATRRGLWFCPFGSTSPIPYYLYLCLDMGLPYVLYLLMTLPVFTIKASGDIRTIDVI